MSGGWKLPENSTMSSDAGSDLSEGWARYDRNDFAGAEAVFRAALAANPGDVWAMNALGSSVVAQPGRESEAAEIFGKAGGLVGVGSPEQAMSLYGGAVALRRAGRLEEAESRARQRVRLFPEEAPGWNLLGQIQYERQDFSGAANSFRAAMKADPKDVGSADRLVDALIEAKQTDEALDALSQLHDLQKEAGLPDRARTLRNWAIVLRDRKNLEEAAAKAQILVEDFPAFAAGWNTSGLIRQARKDLDGAIRDFEGAVRAGREATPAERAKWLLNLADALRNAGRHEEAIQPYRELIDLDPNVASYHNSLGIVLEKADPDAAILEFGKAERLWGQANSPDRKYPLRNWANILSNRSQWKLAEDKLREAVTADEEDADTRNSLAFVLAQSDPDGAIVECKAAVRLWGDSPERVYPMRLWAEALNANRCFLEAAAKCEEALKIRDDSDSAWLYNALGRALAGQGDQERAIAKLQRARELTVGTGDVSRRYILWALGDALLNRERIREAVAVYKEATPLSPRDEPFGHFYYGCALAAAGETEAALSHYEQAIAADDKHPFAHNNKADLLFRMGRYEEGWKAWEAARSRFEASREVLESGSNGIAEAVRSDAVERAVYFANALRDVFTDYDEASTWYELALKTHPDHTGAVCGRAILLRRMSQSGSDKASLQVEGSQALRDACELLKQGLERPDRFDYRLVRADLLIEYGDWPLLEETLNQAEPECGEMRLRRAQVLVRRGILFLATDEPGKAVRTFRQALVYRDDLGSMTYLGQALLNSKQHQAALQTFQRVLDRAPLHIEALIGSARARIELADDGDVDQYQNAEALLTKSLEFGRQGGSTRLRDVDVADVYYMRGYTKTRRYEADKGSTNVFLITSALNDFREAKKYPSAYATAQAACKKILDQMKRRTGDALPEIVGSVLISVAGAIVFLFAQLDFFLSGSRLHDVLGMPAKSVLDKPGPYATVTFGALAIMVAGISLRKLLKLKVGGIELEKASTEQLSPAAVLNIGRFGILEGFALAGLRGQGATPGDLSPPVAKRERTERSPDGGDTSEQSAGSQARG
jgi:tetratricopeptide (TPR) repeat protein